jgi:glycyl-tRNA synthetase beta chain
MLLEQAGATPEILDAVLAIRPRSPLDAVARLAALQEFLELPDAPVLAAINKRIVNILKKTQHTAQPIAQHTAQHTALPDQIVPSLFTEPAEHDLYRALSDLRAPVQEATAQRRYGDSLKALAALRAPVNHFFDGVMVMDENLSVRNNRLALLRDAQLLLGGVADLSRLPG